MITKPRNPERESIEEVKILEWMIKHDIHKWIVAKEVGTFGYTHWQIRIESRYNFEELKAHWGEDAHIEECSKDYEYEKKEGNFISSEDNEHTLLARFGDLRENQKRILENLRGQNDRCIDVICDMDGGNHGKTWLARHLFNTGKGFYVPPTINDGKSIIQYITSGYRREPIIVVDIARSTKWNNGLYVAMETIKDGLVYDTRYHTTVKDIHGVKVLVFCNTKPNLSKLSADRWRLYDQEGRALNRNT